MFKILNLCYECYIQLIQSSSSRGFTKINDDVSTTKLAEHHTYNMCNATCLLCSITQVEYDLNTLITSRDLNETPPPKANQLNGPLISFVEKDRT